jgi:hypothetical protein
MKVVGLRRSSRKSTPLGEGGSTVVLKVFAAVEVTFLIEMIVD